VQPSDSLQSGHDALARGDGADERRASPADDSGKSAASIVADQLAAALKAKVLHAFETAADELLATAAGINDGGKEHYQMLLDAAQHLHSNRDALTGAFCQRVAARSRSYFEPPAAPRTEPRNDGRDRVWATGIKLLDGQDLEFSVTVSSMAAKFERRYQSVLQRISHALSQHAGDGKVAALQHPLGIYPILNEFVDLVSQQDFSVAIRMQLLDAFQFHVLEELDSVYRSVLALLTAAELGARPSSVSTADESDAPGVTPGADVTAAAGHSDSAPAGDSRSRARPATFSQWQQLLAARFPGVDPTGSTSRGSASPSQAEPGPPSPTMPGDSAAPGAEAAAGLALTSFIAEGLPDDTLDEAGFDAADGHNAPHSHRLLQLAPLYERVVDRLESSGLGGARALSRNDRDTLRLVSLLFERILSDDRLSDHARLLLVCLQLPVLRVALHDETFFDDDNHTARRFLNLLAEIGLGWSSDDHRLRDSRVYLEVQQLVQVIVSNIHEDPDYFSTALAQLETLRKDQSVRAQRAETRLIERESGKAKVKAAKLAVQRAVNQLMRSVKPPRVLRQFAAESWSKVLVYLCIKYGADQPQWRDALGLLQDVLTYSQPAGSDQEIVHRELNIPHLLERLEAQMAFAGLPDSEIQRQGFALYELFRNVIDLDRDWFEGDGTYIVDGAEFEEIVLLTEPSVGTDTAMEREVEEELAKVAPGVWLQVTDPASQGSDLRYKVSAAFEETGDLILVDDRGVKAAEWDRHELTRRLATGSARILDNQSLVERAIDALMAELRDWRLES
jgi:hypothetical protein